MLIAQIVFISIALFLTLRLYFKEKSYLAISLFINGITIKSKNMAVSLTTTQFVEGQVTPTDRKGNPASVEAGTVSYTSSDESIATVEEDPNDETKFKIVAKGIGVAQVDFSADADLGEGVKTIAGFVAVEVLPAEAVGFGVTLGTPQEQA